MAGQPLVTMAAEDNGLALAQRVLFTADADTRGHIVHENSHVALQAYMGVARFAGKHGKALGLPLGPEVFIVAARQQRLGQGVEEEGGVFAEAGELASGVVAGERRDEVGGSLPHLECLVHGSGLTVFCDCGEAILVAVGEGKNRWRQIISSGICEVMGHMAVQASRLTVSPTLHPCLR